MVEGLIERKNMSYKVTKKEFSEFKKEAEYWINYFGILDWEFNFDHKVMPNERADCYYDIPGKVVTLGLSTTWDYIPKKNEIKKCAFHEVCELMLCQLQNFATAFYKTSIVEEQAHYVIRTLENTIFKEKRG